MPEAADTETLDLPASEKVAINRMADKFKDAMKGLQVAEPSKPAQQQTPAKPAGEQQQQLAAPAQSTGEPELPVETKGQARQAFETLKGQKEKYRGEAEAAAKERDRYRTELEAVKKNGGPELEALRKEVASRDLIVKQLAIEKDPRFVSFFQERFQNALVEAKEAAGEEAGEQLEQIFALPASANRDKQIEDLAETLDLSDMRRLDLFSSYTSLKKTEREKQAELAKAPANFEIIKAQAARVQQEAELKQVRERAMLFQHIAGSLAKDLNGADPQTAKAILGDTKNFIDGKADTELYIRTLADAARWRRHEPTRKAQAELIETLQGQLSEMQAANPSLRSNGETERKPKTPPLDNSDMGDKFHKAMGNPVRRAA